MKVITKLKTGMVIVAVFNIIFEKEDAVTKETFNRMQLEVRNVISQLSKEIADLKELKEKTNG